MLPHLLTAGDDYIAINEPLTITSSQISQSVVISTNSDLLVEETESFQLELSDSTNAVIFDTAFVNILDGKWYARDV